MVWGPASQVLPGRVGNTAGRFHHQAIPVKLGFCDDHDAGEQF